MSSLHQLIYESIVRKILSGKLLLGGKLPSDAELSKEFGASRQTVLRAMERLCAEGLVERRQGKGSFVARTTLEAKSGSSRLVSFICGDMASSFGQRVTASVERSLRERGYELLLCPHDFNVETEKEQIEKSVARGVEGIILIPAFPPSNQELVEKVLKEGAVKLVCVDYGFPGTEAPVVESDNRKGAYEAVRHLLELGHRRVAFIINSFKRLETVESIQSRFKGYKDALSEAGIAFDEELVAEIGEELSSKRASDVGYSLFGYQPMNRLLRLERRPTAVFVLWDELAFGAMAAAKDSGLEIPKDISFVGYNDDPLSLLTPCPLTTMRQPAEEMGAEAVSMLLSLAVGAPCPKRAKFESVLVKRQSSAAPRR